MTTDLLEANRRLAGEVIAADVENRTFGEAERCLESVDLANSSNLPQSCFVGDYVYLDNGQLRHPTAPSPVVRRLAHDLWQIDPPAVGRILPLAYADPPAQIFYRTVERTRGRIALVALVVDLDQVEHVILKNSQQLSRIQARLVRRGTASPPGVLFRTLFPFWEVIATPLQVTGDHGQPVLAGQLSLAAGLSLVVGLGALLWDNWRRWEMTRRRASLVSAVAHELKTPLAGIRFFVDLLAHATPEEHHTFARVVVGQTEELNRRIDKVLNASRLQRAVREHRPETGSLGEPVEQTLGAHGFRFAHQGYRIACRVAPTLPPVAFDSEAVSDAILNLIENAVKYSGDSRDVEVCVHAREPASVVIEVRDWGIGIPAAERRRIFEQYYRIPRQTGKGGFGLGLYVVDQIMKAHGGHVEVDSPAGGGSSFRLVFPAICRKS